MVHMFCTLKEAAGRLNAGPDEIEAMLSEGILPEFREGPHRLVKTADVGALVAARNGSVSEPDWIRPQTAGNQPPAPRDDATGASDIFDMRLPRYAAATVKTRNRGTAGPRKASWPGQRDALVNETRSRRLPASSSGTLRNRRRIVYEPEMQPQDLSVRQWFWTGLIQDRPLAIAILSGLVLLVLSALVAGMGFIVKVV